MSIKELITKLANLGYSDKQIDMLIDLARLSEYPCYFQGFVTSLPERHTIFTNEEIKDN